MKIMYLFFLLLLQSCFYELPSTGRQVPNDADLADGPIEVMVIKDYYYPHPVTNEIQIPVNEVVIDHQPEETVNDLPDSINVEIEPVIESNPITPVVETIPVVIEPVANNPIQDNNDQAPIVEVEPIIEIVITPPVEMNPIKEVAPEPIESPMVEEDAPLPVDAPVEIAPIVETIPNNPVSPPNNTETETIVEELPPVLDEPVFPTIPLISSSLIPDETRQIVSLFVFYASLFNKNVDYANLIIEIEEKPSSFYIAYCSRVNNNKNPKIKMNRQFWESLTDSYREMLLFHEMGHCLLNRSHQGNNFYNPTSIMNTSLFSDIHYRNNYDFFIRELFGFTSGVEEPILFGAMYEHIH